MTKFCLDYRFYILKYNPRMKQDYYFPMFLWRVTQEGSSSG